MNNLPQVVKSTFCYFPFRTGKEKPSNGQLWRGRPRLPAAFQRKQYYLYLFQYTKIFQKTTALFEKSRKVYKPLSFNIKNRYDNS